MDRNGGNFRRSIPAESLRTALTEGHFPDFAPWTPPDRAGQLVCVLASGRFDALIARYLHAEQDVPEQLEQRIETIFRQ
jgi:hypothetical protein